MDYSKIVEGLKGLITETTSSEDAEKIAAIVKDVESAKQEHEDTLIKAEDLRQKYIKAIQQSVFKDEPQEKPQEPKTLEECIKEAQEKEDK